MNETSNGKVVNRNIVIALGIICIVLVAALIVVSINGGFLGNQQGMADLENQVTEQAAKISSLTAQVNIQQSQINTLNTTVSDYENQIADLKQENTAYASIIAINNTSVILNEEPITQEANATTVLMDAAVYYAGYLQVHVAASTNTTYIQASYVYDDLTFNQTFIVGTDGTVYFPVLPAEIQILLGNSGSETNTATATIVYYY